MVVKGSYNQISPLFVASMLNKIKEGQSQYTALLKDFVITPHKVNIVHYFAYTNNGPALQSALDKVCPYVKDNKQKSPLEYAIQRKSY